MSRKLISIVVICLMGLSLVAISCGQAVVEEKTGPGIVVKTETGKQEQAQEKEEAPDASEEEEVAEVVNPDMPQYGGIVTYFSDEVRAFEEIFGWHVQDITTKLTNEELWEGDWAKGPAGTGEADWIGVGNARFDMKAGRLAESWEISGSGNIVINLREGVHYALNPDSEASNLVGGRELTADDVVWSFNKYITEPTSYFYRSVSSLRSAIITADGKYTVNIEVPPEAAWDAGYRFFDFAAIFPPEVVEKYGDMTDWRVSVGTGPFILVDYVPSSAWTVERNPNYWAKDPVGLGKGNQLPYLDGVRFLIVPDPSTKLAALRTGKVDKMDGVDWEQTALLMDANPDLSSVSYYGGNFRPLAMRTDKPELPFSDVRVRRAMMMATDFDEIVDTLMGGDGVVNTWPVLYSRAYSDAYLPIDEASESVQELYTYNPEKAKELLTEAGYPDGFATTVLFGNNAELADYYSVLQNMWAKVGIDLQFDIREWGAYYGLAARRNYDEMLNGLSSPIGGLYLVPWATGVSPSNASYVSDSHVDEVKGQILALALTDVPGAHKLFRELTDYILDQAWVIPHPLGKLNNIWWPWLKNYHGESGVGLFNQNLELKYVWLDEALKKSMGY